MPLTDYTIGMDSIDMMLKKIDDNPWPVYKIKLGSPDDIQIAETIRSHTRARLRVDANAAWTLDQAFQMIPILGKIGVELIEQPLAKDNWEGMKSLYAASEIPLFADEACVGEQDVERCAGLFHGVNIKLTKCGGITPARRMIARAKSLGLTGHDRQYERKQHRNSRCCPPFAIGRLCRCGWPLIACRRPCRWSQLRRWSAKRFR